MATETGKGADAPPPTPPNENAAARRRSPFDLPTDPYLDWALSTNFRYLGGVPDWIPLLVELRDRTAGEFAHTTWPNGSDGKTWVWVSALYRSASPLVAKSRFCTLWLNPALFMESNGDNPLRRMLSSDVRRYAFGLPPVELPERLVTTVGTAFEVEGPPPVAAAAASGTPAKRVVIGVIDDAFAFCNERFLDKHGLSRIAYLLMQDVSTGGVELTAADIDGAIKSCTHGGLVDEAEVYRITGQEDYSSPEHKFVGRSAAHGTHVMDLAAGYDPVHAPSDRTIIAVQLPGRIVRDTSGANLAHYVINAIRYIVDRADALAALDGTGPLPIVINLSYGLFAGPHDGTSILEQAIDELVALRHVSAPKAPLCVVLPAGNNYLWRTHANFAIEHDNTQALKWRIIPDDRTPSTMEIWLSGVPAGAQSKVKVQITSPDGIASGWISEGDAAYKRTTTAGTLICQLTFDTAATTATRPRITIFVAPTAAANPLDPLEEVAASGVWDVSLENFGSKVAFGAWIQRDDTPFGWPIFGRQSYFDDPHYECLDAYGRPVEDDNVASYVKRQGTLNAIATGTTTIVLGGCRRSDLELAPYSAAGPVVMPPPGMAAPRVGPDPDAMAISEESVACHGVLAAGTRSNSVQAMDGTSVAAPQVTRHIATRLRAGNQDAVNEVRSLAFSEEVRRPAPHPAKARMGAGRINDLLPPTRVVRWEL